MKISQQITTGITLTLFILLTHCRFVSTDRTATTSRSKSTESDNNMARKTTDIQIIDSASFNFGTIKAGDTVTHVFYFKNVGQVPMIITNVTASCDCTLANFTDSLIAPSQIDSIVAIFSSKKGMKGIQSKTITMNYNSLDSSQSFTLYGFVN